MIYIVDNHMPKSGPHAQNIQLELEYCYQLASTISPEGTWTILKRDLICQLPVVVFICLLIALESFKDLSKGPSSRLSQHSSKHFSKYLDSETLESS